MKHLPLPVLHAQQLRNDLLVLPTIKRTPSVVFLKLDLGYLGQGPLLRTHALYAVQEVLLLSVKRLQSLHHSILNPVALSGRGERLRQILQCLGRSFSLAQPVHLVVGEDDVVDDLLPHLLALLNILTHVRFCQLDTLPQTVQCGCLIPPRQVPSLLQQKGLSQEILGTAVDDRVLDLLQFTPNPVQKATVQFAEHFKQQRPHLQFQIAAMSLNTGNYGLEQQPLRIHAFSFCALYQSFQQFEVKRRKLLMRQQA